jgi:membrane protein
VDALDVILPAMDSILRAPAPGLGLVLGILVAVWTASNYVKAFGRAMNTIYEVPEGRGFLRLNLSQYALTGAALLLIALILVLVTVSGPLARSIGGALGFGELAVTVFEFLKWPVLLVMVVLLIALLYWGTPNVRQPKFRWLSVGAVVAIVAAGVASAIFGFYVANFASYDRTYGTLAGVIIFLFWLYLLNSVLLFGAELDAELERGRELQGGIAAEETIQLPLKDEKAARRKQEKHTEAVVEAREIRERAEKLDH